MSEVRELFNLIRELIKQHTYVSTGGRIAIDEYRKMDNGFYAEGEIYEPMLQRKRRFKISLEVM